MFTYKTCEDITIYVFKVIYLRETFVENFSSNLPS
jgi:hypothetical protein